MKRVTLRETKGRLDVLTKKARSCDARTMYCLAAGSEAPLSTLRSAFRRCR